MLQAVRSEGSNIKYEENERNRSQCRRKACMPPLQERISNHHNKGFG